MTKCRKRKKTRISSFRSERRLGEIIEAAIGSRDKSCIGQAGREFEIVLLGRRIFLLEDRVAVLAGLKDARPDVVMNVRRTSAGME